MKASDRRPHGPHRRALLAGLVCLPLACRSQKSDREGIASGRGESPGSNVATAFSSVESFGAAPEWGGLPLKSAGNLGSAERGGAAVVLLHGWGGVPDELLGVAGGLKRPRARFFAPAGPHPAGTSGGRAWWHAYGADLPPQRWDGVMPASYRPNAQAIAARTAVQTLLKTIRSRYAPDKLMLVGFSQGGMLALDLALAADPPVDRAAALSGVLIPESLQALRSPGAQKPEFFVSHGRSDSVLAFRGGQRASDLLREHGFRVTFHPFDGGHEIPSGVVRALEGFLFA